MGRGSSLPLLLVVFLAVNCSRQAETPEVENPENRFIVRFKVQTGLSRAQMITSEVQRLRASAGGGAEIEQIHQNVYVIDYPDGEGQKSVEELRLSLDIEYVEPDPVAYAVGIPNDPQLSSQWAHQMVDSARAWNIGIGTRDIKVGVIDSGVDVNHPDLRANIYTNPGEVPNNGRDDDGNGFIDDVNGWDFYQNDATPDDPAGHGTHVAGTIGAVGNNGEGISGHAQQVSLVPLRFLDGQGRGNVSHAIRAIYYAIDLGVKILSNSWGSSQGSQELSRAITAAESAGILFVVAAGNDSSDNDMRPVYPASYTQSNVLSVAATDSQDRLAYFSNWGPRTVHVAAPGQEIFSTYPGGSYRNMSGTSMATPLVSGVAAMMMALKPGLSFSVIKNTLIATGDQPAGLVGKTVSGRRVNALAAMEAIREGGAEPPPPVDPPDPPVTGIAPAPLLAGQSFLIATNPYLQVPIQYHHSQYAGATRVYLEISRPNTNFSNPNGDRPDPMHWLFTSTPGTASTIFLLPIRDLPGWGQYQIRVIPLDAAGWPVARFSNSATLSLQPGFY